MKEFNIPNGQENENGVCPYCGFAEGTKPKEIYHLYPGMRLRDRYIIGTVLGFGGFGITYKAWDENLNTVVAIKEYYPTGQVQRIPGERVVILYGGQRRKEYFSGLSRFLDEARNMAKFHDNPNIVHVDDFFEENNTAYIVMEFLDGISLKDFLKQEGGTIDYEMAVEITMSIIDALRQIHREGIIHRDISPDNIFLCQGGKIKLIDFGAARFSDEEKEVTRSIILKPGFAPPEQYQSKSKQGPWTDIYALSATLYRCITGVLPDESVNRVVEDNLDTPIKLNPAIPEYISTTIMKGMALNSELRFRSVDELKKALSNEKKVLDVEKELKKRKRKRVMGISIAAVLLLIGCLTAFRIYDAKDPELKEASITVWVSYGEDEDKEEKEHMIEEMSQSFMRDQPAVTVVAEAIPEEEYADRLKEADALGTMPTIYEQEFADADIISKAASVEDVYKSLNNMSDYYFLKDYKKELINSKIVPLGFNVPVVFVRRNDDIDMQEFVLTAFTQLEAGKYYCDPIYYDLYVNSLGGSIRMNGGIEIDEIGENMLADMENEAVTNKIADDGKNAITLFANGEIIFYVSSAMELSDFNANAAGNYQMCPFGTEAVYGIFTDTYCIDGNADEKEIRAAKVWFKYMLEAGPQQKLHVENGAAIPINKSAYETFVNTNRQYELVNDYMNKLVFYPEEQMDIRKYALEQMDKSE
ncbi:MAG: extracellular solute-binding protein [Clostridium sp.]|nr:extracellular solute-binding protein [Clostridium sp.]